MRVRVLACVISVMLLAGVVVALQAYSSHPPSTPHPELLVSRYVPEPGFTSWDYRGEQAALAHRRIQRELSHRDDPDPEPQKVAQQAPQENQADSESDHSQGGDHSRQHSHHHMSYAAQVVAACESGSRRANGTAIVGTHSWRARNPRSTASGAHQFLVGTWQRVAKKIGASQYAEAAHAPPHVQIAAFEALWAGGAGSSHWLASASCWRPMLR